MDTFKLNKGGVLKFDAFCEQSNCNTLWLPNMDKNFTFIAICFQTATLFHGKNIHLWYIVLYQTSDNLQIIHVHVSHFVIYEKNILITLRFVTKKTKQKKNKKKHIILANQPSCYLFKSRKAYLPCFIS